MRKNKEAEVLMSPEHLAYRRQIRRKRIGIAVARFGVLVVMLLLWELMTLIGALDSFYVSSPIRIIRALGKMFGGGGVYKDIGVTLGECILGFTISTLLGAVIAVALWWSDWVRRVADPYLVVLNSLPKIALGPVIITIVGIGIRAIVVMAVLICIVITILTVLGGFLSCDPDKITLMRSMGATKMQIMLKLLLPYSVPNLISVLKMNIGLSWVGTIMGEYLGSNAGLGKRILYDSQTYRMDSVMASIVLLCVLAAGMYFLITIVEKRYKRG